MGYSIYAWSVRRYVWGPNASSKATSCSTEAFLNLFRRIVIINLLRILKASVSPGMNSRVHNKAFFQWIATFPQLETLHIIMDQAGELLISNQKRYRDNDSIKRFARLESVDALVKIRGLKIITVEITQMYFNGKDWGTRVARINPDSQGYPAAAIPRLPDWSLDLREERAEGKRIWMPLRRNRLY